MMKNTLVICTLQTIKQTTTEFESNAKLLFGRWFFQASRFWEVKGLNACFDFINLLNISELTYVRTCDILDIYSIQNGQKYPTKSIMHNTRNVMNKWAHHVDSKNVQTSILSDYSHISPKESSKEWHENNHSLPYKR